MTVTAWIKSTSSPIDDAAIVSSIASPEDRSDSPFAGYQLDTTVDKGPRTIGFKITSECVGGTLWSDANAGRLLVSRRWCVRL
jgi:hypothetical protein